jgi:hypothetical protein
MSTMPTIEAIRHQIDELMQLQSNTVRKITVCPKAFGKLVRELSAQTPPRCTTPKESPHYGNTTLFGVDVLVSASLPQGKALLHYADGTFVTVNLQGTKPPPISPYCDIVRLVPSEEGCWWGIGPGGEQLVKFEDATVKETPWLNNLPR